jgi:hypothetical protein
MFRSLAEALSFRSKLANISGQMFGGKRDLYKALGYKRDLTVEDFRAEYKRNAVANRIVKAAPLATWRGGAEVIEDMNPEIITAFEQAFITFDRRLNVIDRLRRADVLAGIGRYAILVIGAPGELETPLLKVNGPDDIKYLQPYAEDDAKIASYEVDAKSPRYGLPLFYNLQRATIDASGRTQRATTGVKVHYTRVQHVSDGLLDDNIFGEPRLECVFNRLMDLEKVVGGGAEAFWRRADRGMQVDLDPTMDVSEPQKAAMKTQLEEYEHELRRILLTRGVKINELSSDVADFKSPVDAIMALISAGTGIPQRVLMGSEQGKLAAKQDRANWDNRVTDRQTDFAGPLVLRPFVQRMIEIGALPQPGDSDFAIRFSSITTMDDEQRAEIAKSWASLNTQAGETVVTGDEIRERVLDLPPLPESARQQLAPQDADPLAAGRKVCPVCKGTKINPEAAINDILGPTPCLKCKGVGFLTVAKKGGASSWKHVHQAADRFRSAGKADRLRSLRVGAQDTRPRSAGTRPRVA